MAVTVVSWNIATRREPWRQLLGMDADIALLQEATPPPDDLAPFREATITSTDHSGTLEMARKKRGTPIRGMLNPNPPKDTDGRREESGRGGEGATGEIAWVPFGVGRSADGLHRRTGAPMAVCGAAMRGMAREYAAGELSRTGLARVCGDLRLSGGWVADGAVRPGVEWLAAGPRRG